MLGLTRGSSSAAAAGAAARSADVSFWMAQLVPISTLSYSLVCIARGWESFQGIGVFNDELNQVLSLRKN